MDGRLVVRLQRQVPCLPRRNRAIRKHHVHRLTVQFEAQPRAVFTAPHGQWRRMSRFKNRAPRPTAKFQCLNLQKRGLQKIQALKSCAASLPCAALPEKQRTPTCGGSGCNTRNTFMMPHYKGGGSTKDVPPNRCDRWRGPLVHRVRH